MNSANAQYEKMTRTPIPELVVRLSIPAILSMLVTSIYNLVDTAFVGRLGDSASGAVGVVFGLMSIIQAVSFMFGQGSGAIASRKLGERDVEQASTLASTGFFYAFGAGLVIEVVSFLLLDDLVRLLGSTETIAPYAKEYIRFILIAAPFMASSLVLNNLLRYEGKAVLGMVGLITGSLLNIGGDALFMFGLNMGVAGAGLSTGLSQIVSFFILLSMFLRGKTQCRLSIRHVSPRASQVLDIMATGFPSLLRQGLNSLGTVLLNALAGVYGDAAIAAMSIVSRVIMFIFSVGLGVGQGFQPISAFNYGARKYARVRKAYRFTLMLSEGVLALFAVAVLLRSGSVIRYFRDSEEVIAIGTRALRLQTVAVMLLPFSMVTEMQLQSTGQKLSASLMSALRSGLFFIPTLVILARVRGLAGIQEAQPLAYLFSFGAAILFARSFFRTMPREDMEDPPVS